MKSIQTGSVQNFLNAKIRVEWTIELFDALAYIHDKKICHRDLKPSNLFLFTNQSMKLNGISLKIGDFGLGKEKLVDDFKSLGVGTPHYQSPEIISNESYTFKTDVW